MSAIILPSASFFGKRALNTNWEDWPTAEVVAGHRSPSDPEFHPSLTGTKETPVRLRKYHIQKEQVECRIVGMWSR